MAENRVAAASPLFGEAFDQPAVERSRKATYHPWPPLAIFPRMFASQTLAGTARGLLWGRNVTSSTIIQTSLMMGAAFKLPSR